MQGRRARSRRARSEHLFGEWRRDNADRDLLGKQPLPEEFRRIAGALVDQGHPRTNREIGPRFPYGRVEAEDGVTGSVDGGHREVVDMPRDEICQALLRDLDTFGRAGGVDV